MGNLQKFMRGQIWWQKNQQKTLTPGVQSEGRPVVIISNDSANKFSSAITVMPLTTAVKKDLPTHVKILMLDGKTISTALAEQIRTVSADSLIDYIGTLEETKMTEIEGAILKALGFTPTLPMPIIPKEDVIITEFNSAPIITLNPEPNSTDIDVLTNEEETNTEEPEKQEEQTKKLRGKRFTKQERKMIEGYLQHHTLADTAKYFANIYNVDNKTMYSRVANVYYRAKQK